jgi:hypothetical protein
LLLFYWGQQPPLRVTMSESNDDTINIRKGIKNNKLVHIFSIKTIGNIFIPTSIPDKLFPYLEIAEKERMKK